MMTNEKIKSIAKECGLVKTIKSVSRGVDCWECDDDSLIAFAYRIKEDTVRELMEPVNTSYGKPEDWNEE